MDNIENIIPAIDIEEEAILQNYDVVTEKTTTTTNNGINFNFDFTVGDFVIKDGRVEELTGINALKVWILKILKTEKFKFKIYNTGATDEYGVSLMDLIHSDHPSFFIKASVKSEIEEALLQNIEILSVSNFVYSTEKRVLLVNFTVNSIYGQVESEVSF